MPTELVASQFERRLNCDIGHSGSGEFLVVSFEPSACSPVTRICCFAQCRKIPPHPLRPLLRGLKATTL